MASSIIRDLFSGVPVPAERYTGPTAAAICTTPPPPGRAPQSPVARIRQLESYQPTTPPTLTPSPARVTTQAIVPRAYNQQNEEGVDDIDSRPCADLVLRTEGTKSLSDLCAVDELPVGHVGVEALFFPHFHLTKEDSLILTFPNFSTCGVSVNFQLKKSFVNVKVVRKFSEATKAKIAETTKETFLPTELTDWSGFFKIPFGPKKYNKMKKIEHDGFICLVLSNKKKNEWL